MSPLLIFRHPLVWFHFFRAKASISGSAIVRGIGNITIGEGARVGRHVELSTKQGAIELGEKVSIGAFAIAESRGGNIRIGARTSIGPFCVLYGHGGLEIGTDCLIASHVVCVPENHNFSQLGVPMREQGGTRRGINIGDDVWLASQVVILDGVSIGHGAIIGAGAVVTHDIPAYSIAHGVPARIVGSRSKQAH